MKPTKLSLDLATRASQTEDHSNEILSAADLAGASDSPPTGIDYSSSEQLAFALVNTIHVEGIGRIATLPQTIGDRLDSPLQQHLLTFVEVEQGTVEQFVEQFGSKYDLNVQKAQELYENALSWIRGMQNLTNHFHNQALPHQKPQVVKVTENNTHITASTGLAQLWGARPVAVSGQEQTPLAPAVTPKHTRTGSPPNGAIDAVVELYERGVTSKEQLAEIKLPTSLRSGN